MKKKVVIIVMCFISLNILFWKVKFSGNENKIGVYVNDELVNSIPKKGEAMFIKSVCDNDGKAIWNNENWGLLVTNMSKKTRCNLYFYEGQTVFNFDYTGGEQVFTVPVSGTYKLETWGAQGGILYEYIGGYGAYSSGNIFLDKNDVIYINVGGKGENFSLEKTTLGGYNGGGGAGATLYENDNTVILLLDSSSSGGGITGNAGGYTDNYINYKGTGGTQDSGGYDFSFNLNPDKRFKNSGTFGRGSDLNEEGYGGNGGGGGYYGGGGTNRSHSGAGGGSGYIGNSLLKEKAMYCYNCEESSDESTKTISTTCSEETPTENCAKKGNGYARITLISIEE